jgi:hypothetical protein
LFGGQRPNKDGAGPARSSTQPSSTIPWGATTPDNLALIGVFGPLEIDSARAFIFLPPLGSIHEMTSWQSSILEDLLSQRPVSSGILETSRSMLTCARSEPYRLYEVTQNTERCLMNMHECA